MSRARWRTRALGALLTVATLAAVPLGAAPAVAELHPHRSTAAEKTTPLDVALRSMSPSTIPRKGAITLAGTVTNVSNENWIDVTVVPFVSHAPITTRDALAEAAGTAADVAVGDRLTDSGTNAALGNLAPGRTVTFSVRIPVASLRITGDPGVYWIGAHALGANSVGRDLVADGRARTFISLVPPAVGRARAVPVSVVLPLRQRVRRAADGRLNAPARWARLTSPQGQLARLVDFGASAGSSPVSWLVDPAVLDALDDFSGGNPPLSLGSAAGQPAQQPSQSPLPSASPSLVPGSPTDAERSRARSVLQAFLATARNQPLFTLGYADPDVVSLARRRAILLRRADDLAAARMNARALTGSPVVAPPSGYFDTSVLANVPQHSLLLLSDRSRLTSPPLSRLPSDHELVLTDARASAGGPAPSAPLDTLALRQRILAEAALEATKGNEATRPIVVALPEGWDPGPQWRQADFFGGLRTGWVHLTAMPRGASTSYDGELPYGRAQLAQEISARDISAARTLLRTSKVLGDLLGTRNPAIDRLAGAALQATSYDARTAPGLDAAQVLALDATARSLMGRIAVTGTDFVTLSGGSGSLTVTLVNGLRQPVTVGLDARTDSRSVRVATPQPVHMEPGQRTTLRLQVTSGIGVHQVTIHPVTTQGEETGTPLTFSLRTSSVGKLIWYIIFAGGALLAVMIVRRIVLRIRSHRWRQGGEQ